jgi:hypothetical protein
MRVRNGLLGAIAYPCTLFLGSGRTPYDRAAGAVVARVTPAPPGA